MNHIKNKKQNQNKQENNNNKKVQNEEQKDIQNSIPVDKYIMLIDNRNDRRVLKIQDQKYLYRGFRWRKISLSLKQLSSKYQYWQKLQLLSNGQLKKVQWQYEDDDQDGEGQGDQQQQQQVANEEINQNIKKGFDQNQYQRYQSKFAEAPPGIKSFGDNRQIYTLSIEEAQKLAPEQIQKMKKYRKGQQIITAIVNNNQQFQKRTAYSKQKYIKKKQKKYLFHFHAQPISPQNLHTFYYLSNPKAIGFIRWDIFAFMLLQCSPYIDKNVLVMEKTKGLLTGTALYRGAQSVTLMINESMSKKQFQKNYQIIQELNLSQDQKNKITLINYTNKAQFEQKPQQEQNNIENQQKLIKKLQKQSFNSLLILGNYNFSQILINLNKYLILGSPVAFYCQYLEPLSECFDTMMKLSYINVRIYDGWARQYQVLKNRTHPMMYMDSQSGYLLCGIKSQYNKV